MKFRSIPGEAGTLVPGIKSTLDPAEHPGAVDTSRNQEAITALASAQQGSISQGRLLRH